AGAFAGTPAYMASEQFRGEPADARTDQFSYCVALYEALYGRAPFDGETLPDRMRSVLEGRPRPPPTESPPWLRAALLRGLAPRREDRWPSMGTLLSELGRGIGEGAPAARSTKLALGALALLGGAGAVAALVFVLASRGDQLVLVIVPRAGGAPTHEERLMGAVDHAVTNNEWFGDLLRAGRLDWNGTEWVSYSTVQRLWPDGVAHYGDTLRSFHADGTPAGVDWSWGCSHSIEVRLTHATGAAGTGAVCSSDCYPGKGVYFMHSTLLFTDSSGNCAGSVGQRLGGVTAVSDGYFIGFTSAEGRASSDPAVVHVARDTTVGAVRWLSSAAGDASDLHVAAFGTGALAAWNEGAGGQLQQLDATGAPVGGAEPLDAALLSGADDFFAYTNGDVGWLSSRGLVRLPGCH
ncbi:MAG: hypothetical protein WCJ30_09995, partial [Deltaproteobacteria bacterium]